MRRGACSNGVTASGSPLWPRAMHEMYLYGYCHWWYIV